MIGEAEIIVAAEIQVFFAVDDDFRTLRAGDDLARTIKIVRAALGEGGL
jgi:hypothetical protein